LILIGGLGYGFWLWRAKGYPGLDQVSQSHPVTSAPVSSTSSDMPPVGAAAGKGQAPSEPLAPSTSLNPQGPPPAAPSPEEGHMTTSDEPVAAKPEAKPESSAGETHQVATPSAKNAKPSSASADENDSNDEPEASAGSDEPAKP